MIPVAEVRQFIKDVRCDGDAIAGTHIAAYLTPSYEVAAWVNDTIRTNS